MEALFSVPLTYMVLRMIHWLWRNPQFFYFYRLPPNKNKIVKRSERIVYMFEMLQKLLERPAPYAPHPSNFWDDGHISEEMLKSHLDAEQDGATNNHAFVQKSVDWIARTAPPEKYLDLLDLGCGPGIYAERFHEKGYNVTGFDFSKRSIAYTRRSAQEKKLGIIYQLCDYLSLDYTEAFDAVTMINCDFGVLSGKNRAAMLKKINLALKPGGLYIFDVFSLNHFQDFKEQKTWRQEVQGFWSPMPHLCLNASYRYDSQHTFLRQHVVITEKDVRGYYLWDHAFTPEELRDAVQISGFSACDLYGNVAGAPYSSDGATIAVCAKKGV